MNTDRHRFLTGSSLQALAYSLFLWLALAWGASGATYYVRTAATGNGSGSDFNNALALSGAWAKGASQPGNTYFLAPGTYSESTLSVQASGSGAGLLALRKATTANCGSVTGYDTDWNTQPLVFNGGLNYSGRSYVWISGEVANGIEIKSSQGYDWPFQSGPKYCGVKLCGSYESHNRISYAKIWCYSTLGIGPTPVGVQMKYGSYNTIDHCYFSNLTAICFFDYTDHALVEYNEGTYFWTTGPVNGQGTHGNVIFIGYGNNCVMRHNYIHDTYPSSTGILTFALESNTYGADNNWFYGNVFENTDPAQGAIGTDTLSNTTDGNAPEIGTVYIFNNTFIDTPAIFFKHSDAVAGHYGGPVLWTNNLFYNVSRVSVGPRFTTGNDYNWENSSSAVYTADETHGVNGAVNPFQSYAGANYRLVATATAGYPRNKGVPLPGTDPLGNDISLDPDGVQRGADGAWDIGAYEYDSGTPPASNAVLTVTADVVVPTSCAGQVTSNLFTVANGGLGGTLVVSNYLSEPGAGFALSKTNYTLTAGQSTNIYVVFTHTGAGSTNVTVTFRDTVAGTNVTRTADAESYLYYEVGERINAADGYVTDNPSGGNGWQIYGSSLVSHDNDSYSTNTAGVVTYWITNRVVQDLKVEAKYWAFNGGQDSIFWTLGPWPEAASAVNGYCVWDMGTNNALPMTNFACWRGTNVIVDATPEEAQFNPVILSNVAVGVHMLKLLTREPSVEMVWVEVDAAGTEAGELVTNPVITMQPEDLSMQLGEIACLTCRATSAVAVAYQWYKGDDPIVGETSTKACIDLVTTNDAGQFRCIVTNEAGSTTSRWATISTYVLPYITGPPFNITNKVGANVGFTVVAEGSRPLSYQWTWNGTNISGATFKGYGLNDIQTNQIGSYAVIVTNVYGAVTSAAGYLEVGEVPYFLTNTTPLAQSINWSSNFTFSVVASGYGDLGYQWYHNGSAIGEWGNAASYWHEAFASLAGSYFCVVTNSLGSATSEVGTLEVLIPNLPIAPVPYLRLLLQ